MAKKGNNTGVRSKAAEYEAEEKRIADLFETMDKNSRELIDGLIKDAAFLAVENKILRETMETTGMVRIHPQDPAFQKPLEAAKQYRQNVTTYAAIIKTLNGVLRPGSDPESEDGYDRWMESRQREQDRRQQTED